MRRRFDTVSRLGLRWGTSFDLDFHTIPFHGEDVLVEKHYVSKRSRQQKGILAFLAQDADTRVFCYANAELRKDQKDDEILRFVAYWKQRTGRLPEELIFDSKLTTSKSRQLFLDFINASADITITAEAVVVKFQKRAHNPLLVAAGFDTMGIVVPWLGGKRLRFVFG
jgi:hypothetical protein